MTTDFSDAPLHLTSASTTDGKSTTSFTSDYMLALSSQTKGEEQKTPMRLAPISPPSDLSPEFPETPKGQNLTILLHRVSIDEGQKSQSPEVKNLKQDINEEFTAEDEKKIVDQFVEALKTRDDQKKAAWLRSWSESEKTREAYPYLYSKPESLERILEALTDLTKDSSFPRSTYDEKIVQLALSSMHRIQSTRIWRSGVPKYVFALVKAWQGRESNSKMTYLLECLISVLDSPLANEQFLTGFIPLLIPFLKTKISELQKLLAFLIRSVVLSHPHIIASQARAFGETVENGQVEYLLIIKSLHIQNSHAFDSYLQSSEAPDVSVLRYALGTYPVINDDPYWKECVYKFYNLRTYWIGQFTSDSEESESPVDEKLKPKITESLRILLSLLSTESDSNGKKVKQLTTLILDIAKENQEFLRELITILLPLLKTRNPHLMTVWCRLTLSLAKLYPQHFVSHLHIYIDIIHNGGVAYIPLLRYVFKDAREAVINEIEFLVNLLSQNVPSLSKIHILKVLFTIVEDSGNYSLLDPYVAILTKIKQDSSTSVKIQKKTSAEGKNSKEILRLTRAILEKQEKEKKVGENVEKVGESREKMSKRGSLSSIGENEANADESEDESISSKRPSIQSSERDSISLDNSSSSSIAEVIPKEIVITKESSSQDAGVKKRADPIKKKVTIKSNEEKKSKSPIEDSESKSEKQTGETASKSDSTEEDKGIVRPRTSKKKTSKKPREIDFSSDSDSATEPRIRLSSPPPRDCCQCIIS